ncbi:MAG: HD domain-containing protein [Deltaproteobacteria bacterium]|nr:HD domain-containing protein [Deltaproteobacteria bacterium]
MSVVTVHHLKQSPKVMHYIQQADRYLERIGYTEHGLRHGQIVSSLAGKILRKLNYSRRRVELAAIAGLLHDIGNLINRQEHPISSALLAKGLLEELGMPDAEVLDVVMAIGNHEEGQGEVTDEVTAALLLADKADVHRSRVRTRKYLSVDIHDRVNFAATKATLQVNPKERIITLRLTIDTAISQVMEYFEIFLSRMLASRRAAEFLKCRYALFINRVQLL